MSRIYRRPRLDRWVLLASAVLAAIPASAAAEGAGAWSKTRTSLARGISLVELARAPSSGERTLTVVAGASADQKEAVAILERVEAAGLRAIPVFTHSEYEIRVPSLADRAARERVRDALRRVALRPVDLANEAPDLTNVSGPFRVHLLELSPGAATVRVEHAFDAAIGLEPTRELARRHGALAAINGGFFRMKGRLAGDSEGVLVMDGRLLSEPDRGRAGVGFFDRAGTVGAVFDRLGFAGEASFADAARVAIDGINRERKEGEVLLFTPEFHRTTLTGPAGTELVIVDDLVREVRRGAGSAVIPADGVILSFAGEMPREIAVGERVEIETSLMPLRSRSSQANDLWALAHSALGAGPLLLREGRSVLAPELESISRVFAEARHPRTAVASRADGTLLFVTVDGRQPGYSVGMSLGELTDLLLELGATDAVNLDGGGSTTLVVRDEIVNRPSDADGERANGDAILIFAKSGAAAAAGN